MTFIPDEIPEGQSGVVPSLYRIEDDECPVRSTGLSPEWKPPGPDLDAVTRMEFIQCFNSLGDRSIMDGAKYVRALEVGDELGVWLRVMNNNLTDSVVDPAIVIEGVRVSVFGSLEVQHER